MPSSLGVDVDASLVEALLAVTSRGKTELSELKGQHLRALLRKVGLPPQGRKAQLVHRLDAWAVSLVEALGERRKLQHIASQLANGCIYAAGEVETGSVPLPTESPVRLPLFLPETVGRVASVASSPTGTYYIACMADGRVLAWGEGPQSLHDPRRACTVTDLERHPATGVDTSASHAVVCTRTGLLFAWGVGSSGQLPVRSAEGAVDKEGHPAVEFTADTLEPSGRPMRMDGAAYHRHQRRERRRQERNWQAEAETERVHQVDVARARREGATSAVKPPPEERLPGPVSRLAGQAALVVHAPTLLRTWSDALRDGAPLPMRACAAGEEVTFALPRDESGVGACGTAGLAGFGVPSRAVPNATRGPSADPLLSGAAFPSLSPLPSLQGVRAGTLSCGASHVLCVDAGGTLWAWGAADGGRLGHGDITRRRKPVPVEALRALRVIAASAGLEHSAAVAVPQSAPGAAAATTGTLFTWGSGRAYQLGQGPFVTSQPTPRPVEALQRWGTRVRAVACGAVHTACITAHGAVLTWGDAADGRLGRLPLEQARTAIAGTAEAFLALPDAGQRQLSRATHIYGGPALLRRATPVVVDPASAAILLPDAGPGTVPRAATAGEVTEGSHLLSPEERARAGAEGEVRDPGPWLAEHTAAAGGAGGGPKGGSDVGATAREAALRRWLLTDPVVVAPSWLPAPMYGLDAETEAVRVVCGKRGTVVVAAPASDVQQHGLEGVEEASTSESVAEQPLGEDDGGEASAAGCVDQPAMEGVGEREEEEELAVLHEPSPSARTEEQEPEPSKEQEEPTPHGHPGTGEQEPGPQPHTEESPTPTPAQGTAQKRGPSGTLKKVFSGLPSLRRRSPSPPPLVGPPSQQGASVLVGESARPEFQGARRVVAADADVVARSWAEAVPARPSELVAGLGLLNGLSLGAGAGTAPAPGTKQPLHLARAAAAAADLRKTAGPSPAGGGGAMKTGAASARSDSSDPEVQAERAVGRRAAHLHEVLDAVLLDPVLRAVSADAAHEVSGGVAAPTETEAGDTASSRRGGPVVEPARANE